VESLQAQLAARDAELAASQLRLADLERDLVEVSMANEEYRVKVANLGAQLDRANTELTAAKSQSSW
jgi:chromosome segregation ATPase